MPMIGIGIGIGFHRPPPPPKVTFDLLENGLDFITEAVKIINANSDHKNLKYALLNLCSGVELILKEVLRKNDWRYLFQEMKDAKPELLATGDFESVKFKKAITRLESQCKVQFSDDDKRILDDLRFKRNKIEHFKIDVTVSAIKGISAKVLNIVIHLVEQQINLSEVSNQSKKYIRNLPKELSKFNAFVLERTQKIKPKFDKKIELGIISIKCPNCYQKALFIDTTLTCIFCNYTNTPEILALEINKEYYEEQTAPFGNCTKCLTSTLIENDGTKICLSCLSTFENKTEENITDS
jgi:hypothetical protein